MMLGCVLQEMVQGTNAYGATTDGFMRMQYSDCSPAELPSSARRKQRSSKPKGLSQGKGKDPLMIFVGNEWGIARRAPEA